MPELTKENISEIFEGDVEWKVFMAFLQDDTNEIVHIIGYMEWPNAGMVVDGVRELKEDKEFGLDPEYVDTLLVRIFSFPE